MRSVPVDFVPATEESLRQVLIEISRLFGGADIAADFLAIFPPRVAVPLAPEVEAYHAALTSLRKRVQSLRDVEAVIDSSMIAELQKMKLPTDKQQYTAQQMRLTQMAGSRLCERRKILRLEKSVGERRNSPLLGHSLFRRAQSHGVPAPAKVKIVSLFSKFCAFFSGCVTQSPNNPPSPQMRRSASR